MELYRDLWHFERKLRQVRNIFSGLGALEAGNDASPEDSFGTCGILGGKCDRSVGFLRDLVHLRREMILVRGILSGLGALEAGNDASTRDYFGTCGILGGKCDRSLTFTRDLLHWRREMMLVRREESKSVEGGGMGGV